MSPSIDCFVQTVFAYFIFVRAPEVHAICKCQYYPSPFPFDNIHIRNLLRVLANAFEEIIQLKGVPHQCKDVYIQSHRESHPKYKAYYNRL